MIQVDGADNIQTFTGLPRATPSQEAAKEFRVLNSTYLAEYGRALGGFVNIVTKSGHEPRQRIALRVLDGRCAGGAIDPQPARAKTRSSRTSSAGLSAARSAADRTFFFGNYEGQLRKQSNRFSKVVLDNLALLNSVRVPLGLRAETTNQVLDNHYNSFLVKADHHPTRTAHAVDPLQLPRFADRQLPRRRRPRVADVEHGPRQRDARSGVRRQRRLRASRRAW